MNDNTGHGHVWERPDGVKARCGGPGLCHECDLDYLRAQPIGDLVHSEAFVEMFMGYLFFAGLMKPGIQPHEIIDCWAKFKREMGKRA